MGFYFRKSKSMGPFRLNFSKSGVGLSTGVKGARVSFGPRGTYVNVGRNGLYYRKKIGGKKKGRSISSPQNHNDRVVRSSYVSQPVDQQFNEVKVLDNQINESEFGRSIRKDINRSRIIFWLWIILSVVLLYYIGKWAVPIAIAVRIIFYNFFIARIDYELDDNALEEWNEFCDSLAELKKSKKIWMVDSATYNSNTKVKAGAYRNIDRSIVHIRRIPSWFVNKFRVKTDVKKIMIDGKNCDILFLPSDVIVKKGMSFFTYPYEQLRIIDSTTNFIEHSHPVKDAEVIRWTWQYVNKDGSPDRRYKGNVQYPVCRYGLVSISAGNNLKIELHVSNNDLVRDLGNAFRRYRSYVMVLLSTKPVVEKREPQPSIVKENRDTIDKFRDPIKNDVPILNQPAVPEKTVVTEDPINHFTIPESSEIYKEAAAFGANLFSDMDDNECLPEENHVGKSEIISDSSSNDQFADLFAVSEDENDEGVDNQNSSGDKAVEDIMDFFD